VERADPSNSIFLLEYSDTEFAMRRLGRAVGVLLPYGHSVVRHPVSLLPTIPWSARAVRSSTYTLSFTRLLEREVSATEAASLVLLRDPANDPTG
jgi:hypothetical protein